MGKEHHWCYWASLQNKAPQILQNEWSPMRLLGRALEVEQRSQKGLSGIGQDGDAISRYCHQVVEWLQPKGLPGVKEGNSFFLQMRSAWPGPEESQKQQSHRYSSEGWEGKRGYLPHDKVELSESHWILPPSQWLPWGFGSRAVTPDRYILKNILFIYMQERGGEKEREREKERAHEQREWQAEGEGEAGSPWSREPDIWLDPKTLGSWLELKTGAQLTDIFEGAWPHGVCSVLGASKWFLFLYGWVIWRPSCPCAQWASLYSFPNTNPWSLQFLLPRSNAGSRSPGLAAQSPIPQPEAVHGAVVLDLDL